jgi:hypothetical protein
MPFRRRPATVVMAPIERARSSVSLGSPGRAGRDWRHALPRARCFPLPCGHLPLFPIGFHPLTDGAPSRGSHWPALGLGPTRPGEGRACPGGPGFVEDGPDRANLPVDALRSFSSRRSALRTVDIAFAAIAAPLGTGFLRAPASSEIHTPSSRRCLPERGEGQPATCLTSIILTSQGLSAHSPPFCPAALPCVRRRLGV